MRSKPSPSSSSARIDCSPTPLSYLGARLWIIYWLSCPPSRQSLLPRSLTSIRPETILPHAPGRVRAKSTRSAKNSTGSRHRNGRGPRAQGSRIPDGRCTAVRSVLTVVSCTQASLAMLSADVYAADMGFSCMPSGHGGDPNVVADHQAVHFKILATHESATCQVSNTALSIPVNANALTSWRKTLHL